MRKDEPLPTFKFHPDPVKTESVGPSSAACICCGKARGWMYLGPVYAIEEYDGEICPWCIADGIAHETLDAVFHDEHGIGEFSEKVSEMIVAEIANRTPGFSGWQSERWWTHCGDGAQFLGRAGHAELEAAGSQAIEAIRDSTGILNDKEWENFYRMLDKDGSPTAYLFKCSTCGMFGGYQDCD